MNAVRFWNICIIFALQWVEWVKRNHRYSNILVKTNDLLFLHRRHFAFLSWNLNDQLHQKLRMQTVFGRKMTTSSSETYLAICP